MMGMVLFALEDYDMYVRVSLYRHIVTGCNHPHRSLRRCLQATEQCAASSPQDMVTSQCFALLFAHVGARLFEQQELVRAEIAFRTSLAIDAVHSSSTMPTTTSPPLDQCQCPQ